MEIKDYAKELRMILYQNNDSDELTENFERVLTLCDCKVDINVIENDEAIIVDVIPCIQYIKMKKAPFKIFEVIPLGSPLKKHLGRRYYDKEKRKLVEEGPSEEWKKTRRN